MTARVRAFGKHPPLCSQGAKWQGGCPAWLSVGQTERPKGGGCGGGGKCCEPGSLRLSRQQLVGGHFSGGLKSVSARGVNRGVSCALMPAAEVRERKPAHRSLREPFTCRRSSFYSEVFVPPNGSLLTLDLSHPWNFRPFNVSPHAGVPSLAPGLNLRAGETQHCSAGWGGSVVLPLGKSLSVETEAFASSSPNSS